MSGLSVRVKRGEYREILFWLLLFGSWQFLASPGGGKGLVGTLGTAGFLLFASTNLDQLTRLGLEYAGWTSAPGRTWLFGIASGFIIGVTVFLLASILHERVMLSNDWKLVLLQVTLGPVLEEIVFRGYLFALLSWALTRVRSNWRDRSVVAIAAVLFAIVHLGQPGVNWLQMACIAFTGMLYGWIRYSSGSAALAAASHATYNLTLYAIASLLTAFAEVSGR